MSKLKITYIGHATILLEMNGKRILTDPMFRKRVFHLWRARNRVDLDHVGNVDAVLISHLHYDHCDLPSLRRLGKDALLIVPKGSAGLFLRDGFTNIQELSENEETELGDIRIRAVHALHSGFRPPRGPTAEAVGFIVDGEQEIYFAGDTDIFPEMKTLSDKMDIALMPVWGWGPTLGPGHLNPLRAAEALKLLRPKLAIPIHWGTYHPIGVGWLDLGFMRSPPLEFVDHATSHAPDVSIHILQPGEHFTQGN